MEFSNFPLAPQLLRAVDEMGYTQMTDIQERAIPLMLEGRDVIGRSHTGTGKTAAFALPAIQRVFLDSAFSKLPQVLVLSPTRELAMQIAEEMRKFAKYAHGVSFALLYGGQAFDIQLRQLKNANIVIGTPGRIMDHMRRRTLKLSEVKLLILDEADEMLNMGFLDDIKTILSGVPEERQTVLFSATMPPAILELTQQFQRDPELVSVEGGSRTAKDIRQEFYQVPQARKMDALNLLLQRYAPKRAVVFCNTKSMVEELSEYLADSGFQAVGLHGDMKQMARTQVMNDFKRGRVNILVATDVAARGIDVDDIDGVFNFDIPQDYEYYIHRIGRTGRAGKSGCAYTLAANRTQVNKIRELQRFVGAEIAEGELPSPEEILAVRREALTAKVAAALGDQPGEEYLSAVDSLVNPEGDYRALAASLMGMAAARENQRALPVLVSVKRDVSGRAQRSSEGKVRLKVNLGRSHRVLPNHIVGAIVDGTGLPARAVGKIDIYPDYTSIEMTPEDARMVMDEMQNSKIKGSRATFTMADGEPSPEEGRPGKKPRADFSRPDFPRAGRDRAPKGDRTPRSDQSRPGRGEEKDYRSLPRKSAAKGGYVKKRAYRER